MADLKVVAVITAHPNPESQGVVRDALTALVAPTREEEGCHGYDLYESAAAPGTFVTVESWRDQTDLDAHLKTDHIAATFAAAGDHLATQPDIHPLVPINAG